MISRFTGTPPSVKRVQRMKRSGGGETTTQWRETIVKRILAAAELTFESELQ
jgi:hypothetical protein